MHEITLVITTYNSQEYIINQLNSLNEQFHINKDRKNINKFNILIMDDKSKDNTVDLIKKFEEKHKLNIRIHINEKNLGLAKNREESISLIKTKFFIFLDVDDILNLSGFYKLQLKENNIYIPWRVIIFDEKKIGNLNFRLRSKLMYFSINYWNLCGIIFSKNIFKQISYIPDKNMGEDVNSFGLFANNKISFIRSNLPLYFHLRWKNSLSDEQNVTNEKKIKNLEEFVSNIINTLSKINDLKYLDIVQSRMLITVYLGSKSLNCFDHYYTLLNSILNNESMKITKKVLFVLNKPIKTKILNCLINKNLFYLYVCPRIAMFYLKIIKLKRKKIFKYVKKNSFFI